MTSLVLVLLAAVCGTIYPAYSRVTIEGTADNLMIQAQQEPLSEIIESLSQKFGVRPKYTFPIEKQVSGQFSGSLAAVLRKLFEGYDFVLLTRQEGERSWVEIRVFNRSSQSAMPARTQPKHPNGSRTFDGFK